MSEQNVQPPPSPQTWGPPVQTALLLVTMMITGGGTVVGWGTSSNTEGIQAVVSSLQQDAGRLSSTLEVVQSSMTTLQQDMSSLKADVRDLQSSSDESSADLRELRTELNVVGADVDAALQEITDNSERIDRLERRTDDMADAQSAQMQGMLERILARDESDRAPARR